MMIGKSYFERQAMILLRMASATRDRSLAGKLLTKVADLKAKAATEDDASASPEPPVDGSKPSRVQP